MAYCLLKLFKDIKCEHLIGRDRLLLCVNVCKGLEMTKTPTESTNYPRDA